MRNKVVSYLEGNSNYSVGVSLFLSISTNSNLIKLFLRGYTAEREEKLKYELNKLVDKLPEESETNQINTISEEVIIPILPIIRDLPEVSTEAKKDYSDQQKDLYRLRGHYHTQLHLATTDEERRKLALDIMKTQSKINATYKPMTKEPLKKQKTLEQWTREKNLKMYINRLKKELETVETLEKKAKIESKIEQFKTELKQFE